MSENPCHIFFVILHPETNYNYKKSCQINYSKEIT